MSTSSDEGTLVLNQLRASLDGNRYSLTAVYAALVIAFGGAAAVLVVFFGLWHRLQEVYAPKQKLRYRLQKIEAQSNTKNGSDVEINKIKLFNCMRDTWKAKEADIVEGFGLDATIYLRALCMVRNIFLLLTILLFCTAAPINIVFNLRVKYVANLTKRDVLMLLTPSLLSSTQMIPHVVLGWVGNLVVFAMLWYNYRRVLMMREAKFSTPEFHDDVSNRTTMIVDLPKALRSSEGIKRVLAQANSRAHPSQVVITQKTKQIHPLVNRHRKLIRKYERAVTAKKSEDAPRLLAEINQLANTIEMSRAVEVGVTNKYGFGIYSMVRDAFAASRHNQDVSVSLAPSPDQIIWPNMALTASQRQTKQLLVNALYGILLLIWIVPSAFIGCFLSNLNRLGAIWPAFGEAMQRHPVWFAILQGVLAPIITTAVFAGLPALFRRFSKMQGKVTRVDREHEVLRKLYAFFFLDNYFVFSIIGVIWDIVAQVLQQTELSRKSGHSLTFKEVWNSLRVAQRLATAIVNISSFWVIYLLKGILGLFVTSSQPVELLSRLGHNLNFARKRTPREVAESSLPQPFQYATNFLSILFYVTIALGFTTIQPLVLPITLVLFGLAVPIKKYEIVQMKRTNYESNGLYWPLVVNFILFALAFGNLMLLCVVWVQAGWKIAVASAPLAATVVAFKIFIYFSMELRFYYPETHELDANFAGVEKISMAEQQYPNNPRYEDPAYYCQLEKPLLSYEDALQASFIEYMHESKDERQGLSLGRCSSKHSEHKLFEKPHILSANSEFEYHKSNYTSPLNAFTVQPGLARSSSNDSNDSHASYQYNIGAVKQFSNNDNILSPIEPYPAYQSNEGLDSLFEVCAHHKSEEFFTSDDEQHLLQK